MADAFILIRDIETELGGLRVYWKAVTPGASQSVVGENVFAGNLIAKRDDLFALLTPIVKDELSKIDIYNGGGAKVVFLGGQGDKLVNI